MFWNTDTIEAAREMVSCNIAVAQPPMAPKCYFYTITDYKLFTYICIVIYIKHLYIYSKLSYKREFHPLRLNCLLMVGLRSYYRPNNFENTAMLLMVSRTVVQVSWSKCFFTNLFSAACNTYESTIKIGTQFHRYFMWLSRVQPTCGMALFS